MQLYGLHRTAVSCCPQGSLCMSNHMNIQIVMHQWNTPKYGCYLPGCAPKTPNPYSYPSHDRGSS